MKRREFIKGCSAGLALFATARLSLIASPLDLAGEDHIFVLVFLRGGCDGLGLVAPASDQVYNDARPAFLKVGESGKNAGLLLDNPLGGLGFRLHPKAGALKELYDNGDMAILHACGLQNGTRSHFVAMDLIERGLHEKSGQAEGWMARYFREAGATGQIPAVTTSGAMPQAMLGYGKAASMSNLQDYNLLEYVRYPGLLRKWYGNSDLLGSTAHSTLDTITVIEKELARQGKSYSPSGGAEYPRGWQVNGLSDSLKTMARLIKMDLGLRIGQVDFGGWDTHEHQQYTFPAKVEALSESVAAFYKDMHQYHDKMTILVMSEFGRRLRANRSQGTDHGYGNMMMVLGGKVKGGRMYGKWPGLETANLDKGVDLAITTDYRSVLGEILKKRMGAGELKGVFPGFEGYAPLGFLA